MIIQPVPQCKAKDLNNVAKSKLMEQGPYHVSVKYDGNYVQIHKLGAKVSLFTSGGKEFSLPNLEQELVEAYPTLDFILEAEYLHDCLGMLGDRKYSARLTTYRTGGPMNATNDDIFQVFDVIFMQDWAAAKTTRVCHTTPVADRQDHLTLLDLSMHSSFLRKVNSHILPNLATCRLFADKLTEQGWEGVIIKHHTHTQDKGKRVNTAIKLKKRLTADLRCIGVDPGEGKYSDMIGSLVLADSTGRIVSVGSGMSDDDRCKNDDYYLGKLIEIKYERIQDTYIQPIFVAVRNEDNT